MDRMLSLKCLLGFHEQYVTGETVLRFFKEVKCRRCIKRWMLSSSSSLIFSMDKADELSDEWIKNYGSNKG